MGAALMVSVATHGHAGDLRFEHVMNIGAEGRGAGQFKYVEDFAFSKDGKLLATDAANSNVQVFDKTTGKYLSQFAGKGDGDDNMEKPEGIAVDPQGNVFVADYTTGYVKVFDKNYKWHKTFSEYGTGAGQNIKGEFMDVYDGKLYMAEAGNHRVNVFDLQGKFLFLFGGEGTEPGKMNVAEAKVSNGVVRIGDHVLAALPGRADTPLAMTEGPAMELETRPPELMLRVAFPATPRKKSPLWDQ